MSKLEVIVAPDPRLNEVAQPVEKVDAEIQKFIDDLYQTMRENKGAGIAATQVGVNKRIFILDLTSYIPEETEVYFIINPEITYSSKETWFAAEGCLSFPAIGRIEIERPEKVTLSYLDYHGKKQTLHAEEWFARGILHELDHLNGITMLDHLSKLKQTLYTKKSLKYNKQNKNT
jgi:peptide deformylase